MSSEDVTMNLSDLNGKNVKVGGRIVGWEMAAGEPIKVKVSGAYMDIDRTVFYDFTVPLDVVEMVGDDQ